jgi:hypothetical protein
MATLIAVAVATAQDSAPVKFGIRAGLNLGKIGTIYDYSYSERNGNDYYYSSGTSDKMELSGNLIGFHVGAVIDVKILEFLYFQPGIMLSLKGGEEKEESERRYSNGESRYEEDITTISTYYLDVPLMLSLKGTLTNDLALRAHAGPYIGFGLFGKYERELTDSRYPEYNEKTEIDNIFSPSAYEKNYFAGFKKFNFGIGLGCGIEFNNVYLGVNYNIGLTNLYDEEDSIELYERTFSFTLGYNF